MTETAKRTRSDDPIKNGKNGFGSSRDDSQFAPKRGARFRTARLNLESEDSLPLFLSPPAEHNPSITAQETWEETWEESWEQDFRESGGRTSPVSRGVITTGILAASVVAVVCVIFSLQDRDRRAVIAHASASLSAAQLEPIAPATPTREAIADAFKAALQHQPKPGSPATVPSPPPEPLDTGDLASARSLPERAADTGAPIQPAPQR